MNLLEKQQKMIEDINALGDAFDQYAYLIIKAQQLPAWPENDRQEKWKVPGCQSQVWLQIRQENGRIYFDADSDTLILRGVLQLLRELLCGEPAAEVAGLHVSLFQDTDLGATFTSDRNTGVRSILQRIQHG